MPKQAPPYQFVQLDSTGSGYFLTAPFKIGAPVPGIKHPAMILDRNGYLVWYLPTNARNILDFSYYPEYEQYTFVEFNNPQSVWYKVLDKNFELIDSFTTTNGVAPDIHDFLVSSSHTYFLAGSKDSIMDLSMFLFNGVPGSAQTHVMGFVVQEFDANHQLLFEWNSNDHIPLVAAYDFYGYNANNFDYCHGNTIEQDTDGNLLLSFRHLNAVYKIDYQTGNVLWQLGGKANSFSFTNDPGFSGQHETKLLPDGNLAMFDNGNMSPPPRMSRALVYHLDTVDWTATKVWEYKHVPKVFSMAMGGHQVSASGLHLVNYGLGYRPDPSIVLTNADAQPMSEIFFRDSFMNYRAHFYDLPIAAADRPVITCTQLNNAVRLSAPAGFDTYAWSNGEALPVVEVSAPGVYQVWVNYGAGMLGSLPLEIQNPAAGCPVSAVQETQSSDYQEITDYFDLLGRRISKPERGIQAGRVYVVRYADGRMQLKGIF